jgi:hypothetical protein
MDAVFIKHFGPMYVEKESQLPFLVGYILQVVAGSSKAGEALFPKIKSDEQGSKILMEVSRIVARFIESEGEVEIEKVKEASRVFDRLALAKPVDSPTLNMEALKTTAEAFNALPRKQTVPTGPGPNHWRFSVRSVGPRLNPPDIVYLISPANALMHVAAPAKGSRILSLPTPPAQADMVASLLLESFVKGVLKGDQAHHAKFATWTWSCNDAALAEIVEEKFKALGVREELCNVQRGSEERNGLPDEIWAMMKDKIVREFTR